MWKMIAIEMVGMLAVLYMVVGSISGFLYIPILVILLSIFIVVGGKYGLKGVGVSILVFIVNLIIFNAYYNFTCGPNGADVKVMKPMAEKISAYIVKNGIPKSLKDIPDLPYGLERCERSEEYWDDSNNKINNIKLAISFQINEKCHSYYKHQKIILDFRANTYMQNKSNEWSISLNIRNYRTKTVLKSGLFLKKEDEKFFLVDKSMNYYGFKHNSICNTLKQ